MYKSNSSSTNIDDAKMETFREIEHYDDDDSISLTASDFELLNNEEFFERMTDVFQTSRAQF